MQASIEGCIRLQSPPEPYLTVHICSMARQDLPIQALNLRLHPPLHQLTASPYSRSDSPPVSFCGRRRPHAGCTGLQPLSELEFGARYYA